MRWMRALPIALVIVLVTTGASAAARPHAAAPAAAPTPFALPDYVSIDPTNMYGGHVNVVYTGLSSGAVYFAAYDSVDTVATIQINDLNASRDGLTNPVFSYTANFSASPSNQSYTYGVFYEVPIDLLYGGLWNMTLNGSGGGFTSTQFFVQTYYPVITTVQSIYLPDQSGEGLFEVYASPNDAPYTHASVTVTAEYYSTDASWQPLPISPFNFTPTARGTFNFTVPNNASAPGAIYFTVWANVTAYNLSEDDGDEVEVGNLTLGSAVLGLCPTGCASTTFQDGTIVYLHVQTYVEGSYSVYPTAGLLVTFSFESGSSPVSPPNVPASLTTNATGQVALVFVASAGLFTPGSVNTLTVELTDPADAALGNRTTHLTFSVTALGTATPSLQATFDSTQYYSGDTVTATWEMGGVNATASSGWTVDEWFAFEFSTDTLIAWGWINSTAGSGTFTFVVPSDFSGEVGADLDAYNATASIYSDEPTAYVTAPVILLNPSETYYLPGDSITVSVTEEGSALASATMYESVVESSGYALSTGVLTGNSIAFTVPATGTPDEITVSVAAQSGTNGLLAAKSVSIYLGSGFTLLAGVSTKSNYADGSFQPGQTISISYELKPVGSVVLPKVFLIEIYPGSAGYYGSGYGSIYLQETSASGTVSYTIPSDMPAGAQSFSVYVSSSLCTSYCAAGTSFAVNVEPNPSVLGYELGAGSQLTVGWIILLVIILVAAIVLALLIRRVGGRGGGGRPESVRPYSPTPSTGAASTGGSGGAPDAAWKETPGGSESGSGSPPPMPTPKQ